MKKLYTYSLLVFTILFVSCKKQSLQNYLVESQNKNEFVYLDVPFSFIELAAQKASEEDKKALESLKKINVLTLPYKKAKEGQIEKERLNIKSILKNTGFKKLVSMKMKGSHINVYFDGNTDSIDEIVVMGDIPKTGFGLARLLGDNMNPSAIVKMLQNSKIDNDNIDFNKLSKIFN